MSRITIEDITLLNEILKYTYTDGQKVKNIQYFLNKYIDPKSHVCGHCGAQIRFAHKRIINWAERNKGMIADVIKEHNTTKVNQCISCGKELSDKRKKYCDDNCKKK